MQAWSWNLEFVQNLKPKSCSLILHAYGVFHEKGAKFWIYKMGSCGVVFWNKINSFGKSANNPKAQKKMICFLKKLNFVPSWNFRKTSTWYKIKFFQKTNHFLLGLGVVCTFAKGINFISKHHPARAHFIYPKFGPFFVENAIWRIFMGG